MEIREKILQNTSSKPIAVVTFFCIFLMNSYKFYKYIY